MSVLEPTIGDQLRAARLSRFVGRAEELAAFEHAVRAGGARSSILFVHGPAGVGKTTLLEMFADRAARWGRHVVRLDARVLGPSEVRAGLAAPDPGSVVLVDTYELMEPLDDWLRRSYLPSLPAGGVVVLAGRNPPAPTWRADPGWSGLTRVLELRNLRPEESRDFLSARGIRGERQLPVLAFTRGHPLALALVAEVAGGDPSTDFRADREPDVVRALVQQFVDQVPGPRHRAALEACAHLRTTTEERLAEALDGGDDVPELFDWLCRLSFVEQNEQGVVLHELTREVLETDLRWRNPRQYRRLHRTVRTAVVRRVQGTSGLAQQRAIFDLLYLHRSNPVMSVFHRWDTMGTAYAEPARDADLPDILAMVERHEGPESAALARRWYARQPHTFETFRTVDHELIGFCAVLELHAASAADLAADPATRAAVALVRELGPVRAGEEIVYSRFQMGRDTHHEFSPAMDLIAMTTSRSFLTRPRLAWNLLAVTEPELFDPVFTHLNLRRSPEADFRTDGRHFAVYAHDWRAEPVTAWLELMSEREVATSYPEEVTSPPAARPLAVLSEAPFAAEVRRALRHYTRPHLLSDSPLLRSRVLVDRAGTAATPADLRDVLREAAETLRSTPREEKLYRAVHRTYLSPAATQELAAEQLSLPFSTYRAHLTSGIERMTAWLWERELSGVPD